MYICAHMASSPGDRSFLISLDEGTRFTEFSPSASGEPISGSS